MPTKDEIVTCLFSLPFSEHISHIDTKCNKTAVWFTWRGDTFRVSTNFLVMMQIEDGIISGGNEAILMEALIRRAWMNLETKEEAKNVQEKK